MKVIKYLKPSIETVKGPQTSEWTSLNAWDDLDSEGVKGSLVDFEKWQTSQSWVLLGKAGFILLKTESKRWAKRWCHKRCLS